ncbi:hypothetical protein BKA56DRAFT_676360 [Ilyonectria sp. MPI-CAGE-AT-0026]|nr:hypothetical protein BKA56DRAFT_676360 [Ilyonectria sp. MPI-CAGE-AT-0026]
MSDPLGVTASIIAVLQLAATATQYLKDVKNGSTDRMRLRNELRSSVCLLEMLKDRLEDNGDTTYAINSLKPSSIQSLASSEGPLNLFRRILEEIIAKLAPQERLRRFSQPFTWPFDKKDISELLSSLERLKSFLNLVLQNDLIDLAKFANLKLDDIGNKVQISEVRSQEAEVQKVILWISPISFRARHLGVLESVQPGTGTWLLQHETFHNWVKGDINVLWCPGIPGAGKTRLVSLIVDHLERDGSSPQNLCTYVYCDYNQRKEQTSVTLLSSLLQQVLQHSSSATLPSNVALLYRSHQKYGTRPTLTQITATLRKLISNFKIFHVVVDALDECAESEEDAIRFISVVSSLGSQVRLLCTSRFSSTFDGYFKDSERLEISAQKRDIRMFLDSHISQQHRLSRHVRADPSLKEDIIGAIIEESQGMFLLAKLHVESLSQKFNRKEVRSSLKTLPPTLDATYSDALQRVYSQAPDSVEVAESVLFWVICAQRTLTMLELQHLYATRELSEGSAFDEDDLPDAEILTSVCGGLIIVDAESQTVRPVHYTAQQYFERCHSKDLLDAKMSLAKVSLKYLTLPNFSGGVCTDDKAMSQRLDQYPFLDYAAKHWGSEVDQFDTGSIWPSIQTFFTNPVALQVANQAWNIENARSGDWSQEYPRDVPALVLASAFNLPKIIRQMVSDGHSTEGSGSDRETALIRSASFGHTENVRTLLELGASVNEHDYMQQTAVQRAAKGGKGSVVRVLLDGSADVNMRASSDWTALMSAVSSGNIEVVRMLVQAGADLAAETVWGDSALSIATRNGQEAIATFLADSGAILPRGLAGHRASVVASQKGLHQLVRRLTQLAPDYESVAQRPLERQSSMLMGGLSEAQVAAANVSGRQPDTQSSRPGIDDSDFLDVMEGFDYSIGFSRRYSTLKKLGKGHYAEVFLCVSRVTNVKYAVKAFRIDGWEKSLKTLSMRREVKAMEELRKKSHPNILRLVDLFAEYSDNKIYVVMEIAPEGELFNYIVTKQKLTEEEARKLFLQLFSAIEFLHGNGWVHRDVKPENILLSGTKDMIVKLADFGLAKKINTEPGVWELTTTLCGTPSYVAPEILEEGPHRRYGFPVDIWSCGIVLYICLCGFPPFSDELYSRDFPYTLSQQIKMARFDYPSPYWDSVADPALDLIDSMLVVDMERRVTIQECLEHPWTVETALPIV